MTSAAQTAGYYLDWSVENTASAVFLYESSLYTVVNRLWKNYLQSRQSLVDGESFILIQYMMKKDNYTLVMVKNDRLAEKGRR